VCAALSVLTLYMCTYMNISEKNTVVNDNIILTEKSAGLTFGTDALLLAGYIKRKPKQKALELGAGSGIISLLLAARGKFSQIFAAEIQKEQFDIMVKNITDNSLSEKIIPLNADIRSLTENDLGGQMDAVFTNPPYMRCDSGKRNEYDGKFIARHEVCGTIDDFCLSASKLLKFGGNFYAVYRPDRLSDLIAAMVKSGLEPKRMTLCYPDTSHKPCLMLIEGKKGAASSIFVTKPLILTTDGNDSDDMKYIYENGDFNEQYEKS